MRTAFKQTAILIALAAPACAAWPASSALASGTLTGGVSSAEPTGSQPAAPTRLAPRKALATWFGPGFYGKRTACGQTLTPSVLGLANRSLPCGTLVNVSYRGRRLTLPVIDRGPYGVNGAQWDLSFGAARALGMADTARIATRVVGSAPNTPTLGQPPAVPILASTGGISAH
jgi:rare lipoprotein A (peptidoglycan hydrolase)